jgi:hypothetical protein
MPESVRWIDVMAILSFAIRLACSIVASTVRGWPATSVPTMLLIMGWPDGDTK